MEPAGPPAPQDRGGPRASAPAPGQPSASIAPNGPGAPLGSGPLAGPEPLTSEWRRAMRNPAVVVTTLCIALYLFFGAITPLFYRAAREPSAFEVVSFIVNSVGFVFMVAIAVSACLAYFRSRERGRIEFACLAVAGVLFADYAVRWISYGFAVAGDTLLGGF